MPQVVVALGSNLGDRAAYLREAVSRLKPLLGGMRASAVYEAPPLLPPGAPESWAIPFLNAAVCGETALAPLALLRALKTLERSLGRTPGERWGPREIDLDILIYGAEIIQEKELSLPHPGLFSRDFALIPLAQLCPDWHDPTPQGSGVSARALAEAMHAAGRVSLTLTPVQLLP